MQKTIELFMQEYVLSTDIQARYVDLISEVGELGKEINTSTDYGTRTYEVTASTQEELGDCIFSLLALCVSLKIDAKQALQEAMLKYELRFHEKGHVGSKPVSCEKMASSER